jgi:hypothetical protein
MLKGYTVIEDAESCCLLHTAVHSCARLIMLKYTRWNIVIYSAKRKAGYLFVAHPV